MILIFNVLLCLKGNFTTWVDGTLVTLTNWLEPKLHDDFLVTAEILKEVITIKEGYVKQIIKNERPKFLLTENQPLFSLSRNCTAGYSSFYFSAFHWASIACDYPIQAAYVCQKNTQVKNLTVHHTNEICDEGWVLLEDTQNCYLFLKPTPNITFVDSQRICEEKSSHVLSIDSRYTEYSSAGDSYMFNLIRMNYYEIFGRYLPSSINASFVNKIIYGQMLQKNKPETNLAVILSIILPVLNSNTPLKRIKIFAFTDSLCGIIEYVYLLSPLHALNDLSDQYIKAWGAKYRSCFQIIDVDTVICEKTSKPVILDLCGSSFFQCRDQSCVLLIYECDNVNDCSDKSDEKNCIYDLKTLNYGHSGQVIYIPCQLNSRCNVNSQSLLPIHHVCDGIYSGDIFVNEIFVCKSHPKYKINLLAMETKLYFYSKKLHTLQLYLFELFKFEMEYSVKESPYSIKGTKRNDTLTNYKYQQVFCTQNGSVVDFDQRCRVSIHHTPCNKLIRQVCGSILCAGMFKCKDYYCISMSAVCDGQRDCLYGDDEEFCTSLVCPGLLKCRGENRCVGHEEICDGHPDCIHSFDDELLCSNCPTDCNCNGYMLVCRWLKTILSLLYAKGLEITGNTRNLEIFPFKLKHILYLSVTSNTLQNITITKKYDSEYSLLFVNFSDNKLFSVDFMGNTFFVNIITLDVSKNAIVFIATNNIKFKRITILYINDNPLIEIHLVSTLYNLRSLHMTGVSYTPGMYINIPGNHDIIVSDSKFCCILSSKITCISQQSHKTCFGLFEKIHGKYSFYIITSVSIIAYVIQILKILYGKPWDNSHKKHYIISKFNNIVADLFSILYFLTLILKDISKVNVVLWRKENACIFLRILIYISFHTSVLFKTMAIIIVTLKCINPFKHQLRFLSWSIPLATITIWVTVISLQIIYLVVVFTHTGVPYLDKCCSFLDCHDRSSIIHLLSGLLGIFCILIILVSAKYTISIKTIPNLKRPISFTKVTLKLTQSFSFEFFLRIFILSLHIYKFIWVSFSGKLCFIALLYFLPINLISTSVFNILKF